MEWCNDLLHRYMHDETSWEQAQEEKKAIESASNRRELLKSKDAVLKRPAAAPGPRYHATYPIHQAVRSTYSVVVLGGRLQVSGVLFCCCAGSGSVIGFGRRCG